MEIIPEYQKYSNNLKNEVGDRVTEGWKVIGLEEERVVLGKSKKAGVLRHGAVFLFTAPFTAGLGNVAYHGYKKTDLEIHVVREPEADMNINSPDVSESIRELKALHKEGLLSDEEFEDKRSELIDRL